LIYYFLVDFNNKGHYYKFGIETDESKEVVEKYLQGFSHDVRFLKEQKERTRKDRGDRLCPVGVICFCKYQYDKYNTFLKNVTKSNIDNRHTIVITQDEQDG